MLNVKARPFPVPLFPVSFPTPWPASPHTPRMGKPPATLVSDLPVPSGMKDGAG